MLTDCKVGDWIIFKVPSSDRHHIGVVLEEPHVKGGRYKLLFHATILDGDTYVKPHKHVQGWWESSSSFILPYKPTIEEVFKIKQTQEKE